MAKKSAIRELALTIYFQGLCAFIRNKPRLEDTTEVTVALIAGENAEEDPPLCVHTPVLIFRASDFQNSTGPAFHTAALVPEERSLPAAGNMAGLECPRALPALGVWSLAGTEFRVEDARRRKLALLPTFRKVADLDALTGEGAASEASMGSDPSQCLVSSRVFLTDGALSSSAAAGETDEPTEQWVFDVEDTKTPAGTPVVFSQEVRYRYYAPRSSGVTIVARPMRKQGPKQTLKLYFNATIAISNLCPAEKTVVEQERDFLAYYSLLETEPPRRLIPHRLRSGVKVGSSACPPSTLHLGR